MKFEVRKANKVHQCAECGKVIGKRDRFVLLEFKTNAGFWIDKEICESCAMKNLAGVQNATKQTVINPNDEIL